MAVRGSPAKGVDWGNRCVGSNPTFSATKEHSKECSFVLNKGDLKGGDAKRPVDGLPAPGSAADQSRVAKSANGMRRSGESHLLRHKRAFERVLF